MSDLLNQASLVMVPSGYKEDTVYSVVPSNGNGDLSFTRASNGTRVNSAGLVEVCPWNLLDNSQATWQPVGVTVTTGITDPKGNTAGYTISSIGSGNITEYGYQAPSAFPIASGGVITYSIYMKGSGTIATYIERAFSGTYFIDTKVHTLTSEYQLFTHSYTATSDFGGVTIYVGNATGTTANSVTIAFPQVNYGSTAKPYFPTTDRLNVPRLTYQNGGGGCPSLLLEKQSTNLALWSEEFTNGAYIQSVPSGTLTITANYATSPDGTQNADRLQYSGGSQYTQLYQLLTHSTNVVSIYVKSNTSSSQTFRLWGNDFAQVSSNLTATTSWQRFDFAVTGSGTKGVGFCTDSSGNALDISIWGFQFEASSYPTSYIPTTSSSATRVADACFKTGISSLIGQTEGTLFMDMVPTIVSGQGRYMNIFNSSNVNNGWNGIISSGSTPNTFRFYGDGFDFSGGACLFGVRVKVALAYKNGVLTSAYVNGASVGTLTAVTTGKSYNQLTLGLGPFGLEGSCNVNEAVIFPTALTNSELASLTTL